LQRDQRLALSQTRPPYVASIAFETPYAIDRNGEWLKSDGGEYGLCGGSLIAVALSEERECKVEVFLQAELASFRFTPQFIAQGEKPRARVIIEIDSDK
jgi:hypothetical protein